jgi:hypothetical protein
MRAFLEIPDHGTAAVIIALLDYSFISDGRPKREYYEGHFVVIV